MECKNCENSLRTDYSYCPDCGAKVIRNRITVKNLWYDVIERYFNLDNTFLRTIWHLFTKPEVVIGGYINGIRKKYLNPISYLGIALTLSGLMVFVIQKFYTNAIQFEDEINNAPFAKKWGEFAFDFNAFMFLLYFPVLAIPAYLLFNKVKYNFPEYILVFVYTMSHFSIVTFTISMAVLTIAADSYMLYSQLSLLVVLAYNLFVLQRLNKFSIGAFLTRSFTFSLMVAVLFFVLILGLMIVLLLIGVFDLQDFVPQPA
ncbi:DUF3667 domain-containing protein [Croceitalea dokdonensis]|nr:DUF3667 domain-containing protein [Croceitalea dokdonensis]